MNIKKFIKLDTNDNFVTEKADVIQNKLLGDYNAKGKYVINKKIVNELVELKKVKLESYNNSIFVNAKTQSGRVIDFQIDFKKNSNSNLATGVLSTLEPVEKQGGRLTNIIKTPIAKFTNELVPDFVDRTLKTFNVVINDEGDVKERKEDEDAYLLKRGMLLKALDKLTVESYNVIYEDYFTQRINLLKKTNNAYSKKVLAIFNDEFSKVSEYFLIDKKSKKVTNYKAMNELLDKAFEDLSGLDNYAEQEKQYREKILPILGMFIASAERVEKTAHQQVLDTFPRKTRDALTDTLVDIKQTHESVTPPEIQEKNPKVLKTKMDEKFKNISTQVGGKAPVQDQAPVTQTQTTATSSLVSNIADFVKKSDFPDNNAGASKKDAAVQPPKGRSEEPGRSTENEDLNNSVIDSFKKVEIAEERSDNKSTAQNPEYLSGLKAAAAEEAAAVAKPDSFTLNMSFFGTPNSELNNPIAQDNVSQSGQKGTPKIPAVNGPVKR